MGERPVARVHWGMDTSCCRCIKRVLIPEGREPINLLEILKSFFISTTPVSAHLSVSVGSPTVHYRCCE